MSWKDDPEGLSENLKMTRPDIEIGTANMPVSKLYVKSELSSAFLLNDGADKNYSKAIYGAGTAYTLTAVSAAVDMGTTDPVLVLDKAGLYRISARAKVRLVGATFAASRVVTLKVRRTNNTPADIITTTINTGITTTLNTDLPGGDFPDILYQTTSGNLTDSLTLFADVSVLPTAGTITIVEASLVATRISA